MALELEIELCMKNSRSVLKQWQWPQKAIEKLQQTEKQWEWSERESDMTPRMDLYLQSRVTDVGEKLFFHVCRELKVAIQSMCQNSCREHGGIMHKGCTVTFPRGTRQN